MWNDRNLNEFSEMIQAEVINIDAIDAIVSNVVSTELDLDTGTVEA